MALVRRDEQRFAGWLAIQKKLPQVGQSWEIEQAAADFVNGHAGSCVECWNGVVGGALWAMCGFIEINIVSCFVRIFGRFSLALGCRQNEFGHCNWTN